MLLLGLDTSTPSTTVAVHDGERTLAERAVHDPRRHAEVLVPLVAEVLAAAGVDRRDLTGIAAGVGPGPFTGLRVGLVTAAALAHALDVPTFAVCSLDALAAAHGGRLTAVTDARRREVYWARYPDVVTVAVPPARRDGPHVSTPAVLAEAVGPTDTIVGAGAVMYAQGMGWQGVVTEGLYPTGGVIAALAVRRAAGAGPGEPLLPLYLRRPDAVPPGEPKPVLAR